jgi:4-hydroxythreonine-4-phosphate dehydrogenase
VSVRAAAELRGARVLLVGDRWLIGQAARLAKVPSERFVESSGEPPAEGLIGVHSVGPKLRASDIRAGKPSHAAGVAQLEYIEAAYALVRNQPKRALVTGPVSKAAVAQCGLERARHFLGHTEWLGTLDGAKSTLMCFVSERLATSLVTTHLPLASVPKAISARGVREATLGLSRLLISLGKKRPKIAITSLNPHAGESELLGDEERRAIAPGIQAARRLLDGEAELAGPVGAETAYRKAYAGTYDGVVAMYHDQATIPMKLVAFGDAVNVTWGLSVVRTSVDHGTGYDIAWKGRADASGMLAAMRLAARLIQGQ